VNNSEIMLGNFYFIENQYFLDFPDENLMSNKELIKGVEHNRPSFYCIIDPLNGLYWLIPISSQVEKYQKEYDKKIKKHKDVDTIVFGFVMGKKKAFLIQNMFPIIPKYITNEYIDSVTRNPVVINDSLKSELNRRSKKVLSLQRKGFKLIFPDVIKIEQILLQGIIETLSLEVAPAVPEDIFKNNN
jgi:hypothetical protein